MPACRNAATPAVLLLAALWAGLAFGQVQAPAPKIFSCIDKNGRRLSADRPIPECLSQEQKLLNRDGSVRAIARPLASPEEQARLEEQRQAAVQTQVQQEEAARKERQLLRRYPNEAAHAQSRAKAMEPVVRQMGESRARLQALERERDALAQQIKLEKQAAASATLRQRLETNGAALEAQSTVLRDRETERDRMNLQFDQELSQLKALWGAQPAATGAKP